MEREQLAANLAGVQERIGAALARSGRAGPVEVVAVTKGHPAAAVQAAAAVGLRRCGENRVQELELKRRALGAIVEWHLIGHLQRNKVRQALPLFELIQSVDSLRLGEALSREAERSGREVNALVEVNTSGEATKGGFSTENALAGIADLCRLPQLRVLGLMTMAPFTDDEAILRRTFAQTRALFEEGASAIPEFRARHLSMGMSNDFEIAVEEGATMVRLGTVLFGERPQ